MGLFFAHKPDPNAIVKAPACGRCHARCLTSPATKWPAAASADSALATTRAPAAALPPQLAQRRPWLRLRILQPAQPLRFCSSWQRCSQKCCNGCSIRVVTQRATYNCLVCQQPRLPIRSSPRLQVPKSLVCACSATQLGRLQCLSKSRRAGFRRPCECLWRLRRCPG